ncbi:MAG: dihydropteroate synthase [Gammaproteobacteria bacterium]|jgi:dihydropteroate synthase|nr:dihydropteroate synthase [Gammaproteobacteria bacterium]
MGVLNVTPDSFSDGGRFVDLDTARRHAESLYRDGAAIIDIGGESTRPGAGEVSESEELDRVVPIIRALRDAVDLPISVDTSKAGVMRAAVEAGAALINDVLALREPGALQTAVDLGVPVCLMHMQGRPRSMQDNPQYDDVSADVTAFLRDRVNECVAAGLSRELITIDPGFGFGKSHAHNVELLANLRQLQSLGLPVLVGLSRKSTLGELTGRDVNNRLAASVSAAVIAVINGAQIVRAHEVRETVDALRVTSAVMEANKND